MIKCLSIDPGVLCGDIYGEDPGLVGGGGGGAPRYQHQTQPQKCETSN